MADTDFHEVSSQANKCNVLSPTSFRAGRGLTVFRVVWTELAGDLGAFYLCGTISIDHFSKVPLYSLYCPHARTFSSCIFRTLEVNWHILLRWGVAVSTTCLRFYS